MSLAPLDVALIAAFVGVLAALGFSAKLRENSMLQYLVAGRNLSLPAATATLVCTWYGGILGVAESTAFYGLGTWLMIGIPYYCFGIFYALVLAPRVREAAQYSIPERMEVVFGRKMGALAAGLVFLLAVPAAHMLMIGSLMQWVSGWPLVLCMALAALLASLLLAKGGFLADVRISLLAFVAMFTGFGVMAGTSLMREPLSAVVAGLPAPLQTPTGGQSWGMILSFFLLGAWTLADPGFHQRVASARTPQIGQRTVLVSVVCWMVFDLLSITTALYALSNTPKDTPALQLFPAYANLALPPGVKALFFCGMLGTILSALVGYSLVAGASLGRDGYRALAPSSTEDQQQRAIKWAIGLSTLLAAVLGATIQSVVALWYSWAGIIIGALLVPLMLAYRLKGIQPASWLVFSATSAGFLLSFAWWIFGLLNNNPYLTIRLPDGTDFGLGTLIPGLLTTGTIIAVGSAVHSYRSRKWKLPKENSR